MGKNNKQEVLQEEIEITALPDVKNTPELPQETIEKLLKNEFQMDSIGTDDVEINLVEPSLIEKEEDVKDVKSEKVKYNKVDFKSRGFSSLEEAIAFMDKPYFKGLGKADREEYRNWLIKK